MIKKNKELKIALTHLISGICYSKQVEYDKSIEQHNIALEKLPDFEPAFQHARLAQAYFCKGDYANAKKNMQKNH